MLVFELNKLLHPKLFQITMTVEVFHVDLPEFLQNKHRKSQPEIITLPSFRLKEDDRFVFFFGGALPFLAKHPKLDDRLTRSLQVPWKFALPLSCFPSISTEAQCFSGPMSLPGYRKCLTVGGLIANLQSVRVKDSEHAEKVVSWLKETFPDAHDINQEISLLLPQMVRFPLDHNSPPQEAPASNETLARSSKKREIKSPQRFSPSNKNSKIGKPDEAPPTKSLVQRPPKKPKIINEVEEDSPLVSLPRSPSERNFTGALRCSLRPPQHQPSHFSQNLLPLLQKAEDSPFAQILTGFHERFQASFETFWESFLQELQLLPEHSEYTKLFGSLPLRPKVELFQSGTNHLLAYLDPNVPVVELQELTKEQRRALASFASDVLVDQPKGVSLDLLTRLRSIASSEIFASQ